MKARLTQYMLALFLLLGLCGCNSSWTYDESYGTHFIYTLTPEMLAAQ